MIRFKEIGFRDKILFFPSSKSKVIYLGRSKKI